VSDITFCNHPQALGWILHFPGLLVLQINELHARNPSPPLRGVFLLLWRRGNCARRRAELFRVATASPCLEPAILTDRILCPCPKSPNIGSVGIDWATECTAREMGMSSRHPASYPIGNGGGFPVGKCETDPTRLHVIPRLKECRSGLRAISCNVLAHLVRGV
jgi:hypothetical protein